MASALEEIIYIKKISSGRYDDTWRALVNSNLINDKK